MWTFTVIGIPGHPAWRPDVPYVVAVVELDEGPRVLTNIVDCDPTSVVIGQRVQLHPTRQADTGQLLMTFRPDAVGGVGEFRPSGRPALLGSRGDRHD